MSPNVYSWLFLLIVIIHSNVSMLLSQTCQSKEISVFLERNHHLFSDEARERAVGVFTLSNSSVETDELITDWLPKIGRKKIGSIRIINDKISESSNVLTFTEAIVFLDSFDLNIISTIQFLFDNYNYWKRETNYVFIFANIVKGSSDTLRSYIKLFWKHERLLSFIIVCVDSFSTLQVLSYNPFKDEIANFTEQQNYSLAALFPNKAENLYGYKLNVSYLITPPYVYERDGKLAGKDYDFIMTFLKAINASARLKRKNSFSELGAINGSSYDLVAQGLFLYARTLGRAAYPHSFVDIVTFVEMAPLISTTTTLLYMFDIYTWSSMFAFLIIFYSLKLCWKKILFGQKPNFSLRILIFAFSVFNIIMSQTFQSWITTFLIYPKRGKDIDTIDELVESKIEIYTLDMWKDLLTMRLHDQYIYRKESDLYVEAFSKRKAFLLTYDNVVLMSLLMQDRPFHQVQEHVGTAFIMFYLGNKSPYRKVLKDLILRSLAYGYSSKEWGGYEFAPEKFKKQFKRLELTHLQGVILLWAVGLTLSVLVFLVELYSHH